MRNKVYGITVEYVMGVIYVEYFSSISIFSLLFLFENSSLRDAFYSPITVYFAFDMSWDFYTRQWTTTVTSFSFLP